MNRYEDGDLTDRLIRDLARAVVRDTAEERLEELDERFPTLLRLVERHRRTESEEPGGDVGSSGLPFDLPSAGAGFGLATIVWLAFEVVKSWSDGTGETPPNPAKTSEEAEMVDAMRRHLPSLLAELEERPSDETEVRRHLASEPSAATVQALATAESTTERSETPAIASTPAPARSGGIDLRLVVLDESHGGQRVLRFVDGGGDACLRFEDYRSRPLHDSLHGLIRRRLDALRNLPASTPEPADVDRRLRNLGRDLADELLPRDLARRLVAHAPEIRTLQIASDEPSVPWEILALSGEDGEEPWFLGERFLVTRWRRGPKEPRRLPLRRLALIAPSDSGLPSMESEVDKIAEMLGEGRAVRLPARQTTVLDGLRRGAFDGWHFATHAAARADDPSSWRLALEGGGDLTPADFGPHLADSSPLVFLNACSAGQSAPSLTGLGGFADKLVSYGAGAVIGPLWAVPDAPAQMVATSFFRRFLGGEGLAEALRGARIEVRRAFPGDPTWLAYVAFGHPEARIGVSDAAGPSSGNPSGSRGTISAYTR